MKRSLCFSVLAALACESAPTSPSDDAVALTVTDFAEYVLPDSPTERATIRFVFSNRTNDTVWIVDCGGPWPDLEKLVDGAWVLAARRGPRFACLGAHRVETGALLRGEFRVEPELLLLEALPGTYRLVWPDAVWSFDHGGPPWGDVLPHGYRISSRFSLR